MKRLSRSEKDKKILGVCGGLGEYFDVDPVLMRVLFIFVTLATGIFPGIIAYIIAAMVMPKESDAH
jgi:phage shock protein C